MAPATPASHQAWRDVVEADYFVHCRLPDHALLLAGISFLGSMNKPGLSLDNIAELIEHVKGHVSRPWTENNTFKIYYEVMRRGDAGAAHTARVAEEATRS